MTNKTEKPCPHCLIDIKTRPAICTVCGVKYYFQRAGSLYCSTRCKMRKRRRVEP